MKKLLLTLFLLTIPFPSSAKAITWGEFWEPFTKNERHYYHRYYDNRPYYGDMCTERVYREEYVPGNRWRSGYVRRWSELVTYRCPDYD